MKRSTLPILFAAFVLFAICQSILTRAALKKPEPAAPRPVVAARPAAVYDATKLDARIHDLRVREYRGALFEQMAIEYLRGRPVDPAQQVRVARAAAEEVAKHADEFSRAALLQGADEFARAIEEAQRP